MIKRDRLCYSTANTNTFSRVFSDLATHKILLAVFAYFHSLIKRTFGHLRPLGSSATEYCGVLNTALCMVVKFQIWTIDSVNMLKKP